MLSPYGMNKNASTSFAAAFHHHHNFTFTRELNALIKSIERYTIIHELYRANTDAMFGIANSTIRNFSRFMIEWNLL